MTVNVADKYSLDMTGASDNAPKLARMAADVAELYTAKKPIPRLLFPEGLCAFSAWPDLAYDKLQIVAEGECRLITSGEAKIVFDASLRDPESGQPGNNLQPNVNYVLFEGFDVYAPLVFRGIHRSRISTRVFGFAVQLTFCIITTLRPQVSASPIGVLLDAWPGKPTLQSTASTIQDPCLEGCSIGIDMQSAGSCAVYNGTIESCATGVHLGADAGNNMFYSVEMETNGQDVRADGGAHNNGFMYCGNSGKLTTNFGLFSSNWYKT